MFQAWCGDGVSDVGTTILVLSGAYIGYLPEHYAQHWADQGRLRVLSPATFGYQALFSLILRRGRSREPLIQSFRDLLKIQLNQI